MNKKLKKILIATASTVLALGVIIGGFCLWLYKDKIPYGETETIAVGDGETIKVGVISDTQLRPKREETVYAEHLRTALKELKEQKVDVIIHAGDIGDMNSIFSYAKYNKIFKEIYGKDEAQYPETVYIMGNHDTWWNTDYNDTYIGKHRKFYTMIGENPYTHRVINGFHFIAVSPDGPEYSEESLGWMEEQIKLAREDSAEKPIFVITHHNPQDTVYGSVADWSEPNLDGIFRKYSNVVSISGHSHFSILDERSIYQNQYTAFTTQSIAYIENEKGKFDAFKHGIASVPPRDEDYPMMLIMNVYQDKTEIHRWNITENKEEKADRLWTLNYPLVPENFVYGTAQREAVNKAPVMGGEVMYNPAIPSHLYTIKDGEDTLPGITFKAGTDDDLVHSYRVVLRGTKEISYDYFSDFYNGIDNMKPEVNLALDTALPNGDYEVSVYAVDSFGLVSEGCAKGTIHLER